MVDPATCVFTDDSGRNITVAKEMGWQTVLVGPERDGAKEGAGARTVVGADVQVDTVHELRGVFPDMFVDGASAVLAQKRRRHSNNDFPPELLASLELPRVVLLFCVQ